jgi:hypothetical protein
MTMVHQYKYYVSGHYPPSYLYFKTHSFGDWILSPEIGTSSIDWGQLTKFHLKMETESSLRNVVFLKINRTVFQIKTGGWIMSRNIIFVMISSLRVISTSSHSRLGLLSTTGFPIQFCTHFPYTYIYMPRLLHPT